MSIRSKVIADRLSLGKRETPRSPGMKPEFPHSARLPIHRLLQLQCAVGNQAVGRWIGASRHDRFSSGIGATRFFRGSEGRKMIAMDRASSISRIQRQPAAEIDEQTQKQAAKKIRDAFTFPDGYVSPKFTPHNAKLVEKGKEMLTPDGELAQEMAQGRDVTYERELETGGTQSFTEKKSVTVPGDVSKFPVLVTWELWSIFEALKTSSPDDAALLALIGVLEEFWIDHTGYPGATWVPDIIEINALLPAKGFTKIMSIDLIPRSIVFIDQHALIEPGPYRGLPEADKAKRTVDIVTAHELIHALGYTDAWIHPFLKLFGLFPKLDSDMPGDVYEQEADRVATTIMGMTNEEKTVDSSRAVEVRNVMPAGLIPRQKEKSESEAKPINIAKAVAENKKRLHDKRSILLLQNLFNMGSPTGTFDAQTIGLIDTFQKANDVFIAFEAERGIVTAETLKAVFEKLLENKQYNPLIYLMIDYYLRDTYHSLKSNIVKLEYDKDLAEDGSFTTTMNENEFEITIGETAFRYYEYLAHTIGHEFEHAKQKKERLQRAEKKKPLLPEIGVDEFRAEAFNILTERLPMKRFDDFMDDAKRALAEWQTIDWSKVPDADADVLVGLYKKVRKRVIKIFTVFENSSSAEKHRNVKEQYERLEPKIINVK